MDGMIGGSECLDTLCCDRIDKIARVRRVVCPLTFTKFVSFLAREAKRPLQKRRPARPSLDSQL